ncbi:MAG: ABC transporter ATP-binding protein [Erysipelotrichales bacterium]|nr:ABC transporter ATP-binding protein [Erysipelotrichales bacterium]
MLEIKNLKKKYGKYLAVNDVSFTIDSGRTGIILGPNGAGKSTIIKSIAGLLRYDGAILIQGVSNRFQEAKKNFGYVPEIPYLYDFLTVEEHIDFMMKAYGKDDYEYKEFLLKRFELDDKREKLGKELSKGMMQKVSLCCALIIKPQVIMFDEPMVGLDPKAIKELKETIQELKQQGVTVLISTHMLDMVKNIWDDMIILDQGKVIAQYKREDVLDNEIEDIFFEVIGEEKGDDNE